MNARWLLPLMLILAAAVYLTALGTTPLRVNAEIRCHGIVKSMLDTGDYLVPRLDGEWRVNKPPLFYWLSAASAKAMGGFDLFSFRFPAVLLALGLLLVTWRWAGYLGMSRPERLLAVALLALSYNFVLNARRGSFETLLSLTSAAGLLAGTIAVKDGSRRAGAVAATMFGLGFLAKATPILLLLPLPLAAWLAGMRRGRLLVSRGFLAAAFAGLAAGLSWYVFLFVFRPESRQTLVSEALLPFGVKVGGRSTAEHREMFYFYLFQIWPNAWPMSGFLPLALLHARRRRWFPADSPWRLLLLAFVIPFVVFSIIPQKRDDYLLPLYAPLALLTARALTWGWSGLSGGARRWLTVPSGLIVFFVGFSALLLTGWILLVTGPRMLLAACVAMLACAGLAVAAFRRRLAFRACAAGLAGMVIAWWAYFGFIRPVVDGFGSGAVYEDPAFRQEEWEAKFEKYPLLRRVLFVEKGLKRVKK